MNDESELLPTLTPLLTMKRMEAIGTNQGLLLVSISHMMKTTTMSAKAGAHLPKAWEMMR